VVRAGRPGLVGNDRAFIRFREPEAAEGARISWRTGRVGELDLTVAPTVRPLAGARRS
jgi:hypothetical protein